MWAVLMRACLDRPHETNDAEVANHSDGTGTHGFVYHQAKRDRPHLCRGFGGNGPSESGDKGLRAFFCIATNL